MAGQAAKAVSKRERFLSALAESANISAACRAAGIVRATAYRWREKDARFAERWSAALEAALDDLEASARQRALEGNSTLLIFLLKAHRPEVYRERAELRVVNEFDGWTDGELEEYARTGKRRINQASGDGAAGAGAPAE